ncbi:MAG: flagellar type III secretion system pore protein FliP [Chthonomonadaceae bacterium]|nr:flagellar type III secretion system pore protein FliP [Chthonomonadaceae bacterium]
MNYWRLSAFIILVAIAGFALAQSLPVPVPQIQVGVGPAKSKDELSTSLQILALLTVLSVAPALLILTTAFTRIVIILSFVRTALGTQSIPPNQVIIGLSLFLTLFVMGPTFDRVNKEAIQPYTAKNSPISFDQALARAQAPVKEFMLKSTYEGDLKMFLDMRKQNPKNREQLDIMTLIPAFVISELTTAFIIGFYIFVPFVIIDLIVASVLMGMGMMMMPPVVVSLPAKLLVFVMADGWAVLAHAILSGYS